MEGWSDSDESTAAGVHQNSPVPVEKVSAADADEALRFGSVVDLAAKPLDNKWLHDWSTEEYEEVSFVDISTFCRQFVTETDCCRRTRRRVLRTPSKFS